MQDRRLAEIGGKGLFAKEIHEALADRRIDFAVHSLKDLETTLPPGIVLACTLRREDARDALILGAADAPVDPADPFACLPLGALIGTASVRRQAQLLHARPDLGITTLRGNVQTRLDKLDAGACAASLLAYAGLKRLGLAERANVVLDPDVMVPAAGQGIVGVTVRETTPNCANCSPPSRTPRRRRSPPPNARCWPQLDGSCRTPIGGYAQAAAGWRAAPHRAGGARRWLVPAEAQPARRGRRRRQDRQRTGRQPARRQPTDIFA